MPASARAACFRCACSGKVEDCAGHDGLHGRTLSLAASLLRPTDTGPTPPAGSMPNVRAACATSLNSSVSCPAVSKPCKALGFMTFCIIKLPGTLHLGSANLSTSPGCPHHPQTVPNVPRPQTGGLVKFHAKSLLERLQLSAERRHGSMLQTEQRWGRTI